MQLTLWPSTGDKVLVLKNGLYLQAVVCCVDGSLVTALIQSTNTWWLGPVAEVTTEEQ